MGGGMTSVCVTEVLTMNWEVTMKKSLLKKYFELEHNYEIFQQSEISKKILS